MRNARRKQTMHLKRRSRRLSDRQKKPAHWQASKLYVMLLSGVTHTHGGNAQRGVGYFGDPAHAVVVAGR